MKKELVLALIAAIGITNQRETTIAFEKTSGKPIYNAIVWQDLRGADFINKLSQKVPEKEIRKKTGLLFSPYFSGSKIAFAAKCGVV